MVFTLPRRSLIRPENPSCPATGECCTPASDQRPPAFREEAPTAAAIRPSPVGLALPLLGGLAFVAGDCQTRNSRWLAPQGISPLLDVEDPQRQDWAAGGAT